MHFTLLSSMICTDVKKEWQLPAYLVHVSIIRQLPNYWKANRNWLALFGNLLYRTAWLNQNVGTADVELRQFFFRGTAEFNCKLPFHVDGFDDWPALFLHEFNLNSVLSLREFKVCYENQEANSVLA